MGLSRYLALSFRVNLPHGAETACTGELIQRAGENTTT